jgi:hypothetical protein
MRVAGVRAQGALQGSQGPARTSTLEPQPSARADLSTSKDTTSTCLDRRVYRSCLSTDYYLEADTLRYPRFLDCVCSAPCSMPAPVRPSSTVYTTSDTYHIRSTSALCTSCSSLQGSPSPPCRLWRTQDGIPIASCRAIIAYFALLQHGRGLKWRAVVHVESRVLTHASEYRETAVLWRAGWC